LSVSCIFCDSPETCPHFSEWSNASWFDEQVCEGFAVSRGQHVDLLESHLLFGFEHGFLGLDDGRDAACQVLHGAPVGRGPVDHIPHVEEVGFHEVYIRVLAAGVLGHFLHVADGLTMRALEFLGLAFGLGQFECVHLGAEQVVLEHRLPHAAQVVHQRDFAERLALQVQSLESHLVFVHALVALTIG